MCLKTKHTKVWISDIYCTYLFFHYVDLDWKINLSLICVSELATSKVDKVSKRKVERLSKDSEPSTENAKKINSDAATENGRWNNELRNQQNQLDQVWPLTYFKKKIIYSASTRHKHLKYNFFKLLFFDNSKL